MFDSQTRRLRSVTLAIQILHPVLNFFVKKILQIGQYHPFTIVVILHE